MSFFSEFGDKIKTAAKSAGNSTKTGVEATKQRLNLKAKKDEITRLYGKLGELFYTTRGEAVNEMGMLVEQIDRLHAETAEMAEQIDRMSNVRRCEGCGKIVTRRMKFCPDCGTPVPTAAPIEMPTAEAEPTDAEAEEALPQGEPFPCPNCGTMLPAGTKCCMVCGMEIE